MRFDPALIEGRLLRRYKRFLADIELANGETVIAHCPNPGSMKTCQRAGARVWLSPANDPKRKLRYTWELVEIDDALLCIHTGRANTVVWEAITEQRVPALGPFDRLRREVPYGERSRVDLVLERGELKTYVEVKSVTLAMEPGIAAFPDAITARGTRHLHELAAMRAQGHRAVLLYCVNRSDATQMRSAWEIDPVYAETLQDAIAGGVEVLAFRCEISPAELKLGAALPIAGRPATANGA